jgi:hypothetical protein
MFYRNIFTREELSASEYMAKVKRCEIDKREWVMVGFDKD